MKDPNYTIDALLSVGALKALVIDAWTDSASETADRIAEALATRQDVIDEAVPNAESVLVGNWEHIFSEDGMERARMCSIVIDNVGRVVAATIGRDGKQRDASETELADIQESIEDNDVFSDPEVHDFEEDVLPTWAADQIHGRFLARPRS